MTLPRLFKRRSRKSLSDTRKDSTSTEPVPPLAQDHSRESSAARSSSAPLPHDAASNVPSPGTASTPVAFPVPQLMNGTATTLVESPQPYALPSGESHTLTSSPPSLPADVVQDRAITRELTDASQQMAIPKSTSKVEKTLDTLEDTYTAASNQTNLLQSFSAPAKAALTAIEATSSVQAIQENVSGFMEGIPVLMKALDEVAKLHPFIGVALLAFKAVYTLEMKRRANDKKITALFAEMKDMMGILTQLRRVKDEAEVGPDNTTIKARMQSIVQQAASDIKDCANACDTYSKKKLIVKVLKGPIWETTLVNYAAAFTKRRTEFEFALAIHTGLAVDKANETLGDVDVTTRLMNEKIDVMLMYFQSFVPPDQKDIAALIQRKGGPSAVIGNDAALKELTAYEKKRSEATNDTLGTSHGRASYTASDFEELETELHEDPATAIDNNFKTFERKFEMQQRQIVEELSRVVHHEGDRIIETVTAGPHDRVIDPYLHAIWKDMGWRGSVKARHFVLTLRDFYYERFEEKKRKEATFESAPSEESDEWAMEWVNVKKMQPIIEAFDDDASGFITVHEANRLTTSRPLNWSLLHWLAYWAVGWQISADMYREKINDLTARMFSLRPLVHPANRNAVDQYLQTVWPSTMELTMSLRGFVASDALQARFQSFVDDEEKRIRENLEAIRYDIDADDTLSLVVGSGRIEKYLFPLLYLLLKRHYEILRLCRTNVINRDELWDAADTVQWVFDAVRYRHGNLEDIFKQQKLDVGQQFKVYACELFDYWHDSSPLWGRDARRSRSFREIEYDDESEEQNVDTEKILNYPLQNEYSYACEVYNPPENPETEEDKHAEGPLKAILGMWCGFLSEDHEYPSQSMVHIWFHVSPTNSSKYEATSRSPEGTTITVIGTCETTSTGEISYHFSMTYAARFTTQVFEGRLDEDAQTLSGYWGYTDRETPKVDEFVFKRVAPDIICFRPSPEDFRNNKAQALWRYATLATLHQVRQRLFSWSLIKARRDKRKRYLELFTRRWEYGRPLDADELAEFARCRQANTTADARFYATILEYQLRTTPKHIGIDCDNCGGIIGGTRAICLDCDTRRSLDLCNDIRCLDATIDCEKRSDLPAPHVPSHSIFKIRAMLHLRDFGKTELAARSALKKAREVFREQRSSEPGDEKSRPPSCSQCLEPVSQPCWYCFVCEENVFICDACERKPLVLKEGQADIGHKDTHGIVRCQEEASDQSVPVDQRLDTLETQFQAMQNRLGSVDDRLLRMEKLLEVVISKLVGSPFRLDDLEVPSQGMNNEDDTSSHTTAEAEHDVLDQGANGEVGKKSPDVVEHDSS